MQQQQPGATTTCEESFGRLQPICFECLSIIASSSSVPAAATDGEEQESRFYNVVVGESLEKLHEELEKTPREHLAEFHQFVTLPMKLLLKKGNCPEATTCRILGIFSLVYENVKLDQWNVVKDLLTQLMLLISSPKNADDLLGTEHLKIRTLKCLKTVFSASLTSDVKSELYSETNLSFLGHSVYVILRILEKEKSAELKLLCLQILKALTGYHQDDDCDTILVSDAFACLLPGCLITLNKVVTQGLVTEHHLLTEILELWAHLYCLVCSDSELDRASEEGNAPTKRTADWFSQTGKKASELVRQILRVLVNHGHFDVRLSLLSFSSRLLCECVSSLESCQSALVDAVAASVSDEYESVSERAHEIVQNLQNSKFLWPKIYSTVEENLYQLCTALPRIVRQGTSDKAESTLVQLSGYIQVLGTEGMRKICLSSPHLRRLTLALCQIADFDIERIAVVSEIFTDMMEKTSPERHKPEIPMKYVSSPDKLIGVCHWMGKLADSFTIVDHMLDLAEENCGYHEPQAFFLLNHILSAPGIRFDDKSLIDSIVQTFLERLSHLKLDGPVADDRVSDLSFAPSKKTVTACLVLDGLAVAVRILEEEFRGPLLMKTLYPVLECVTSNQIVVKDTALWTLSEISCACGYGTVADLLQDNSDYLLYSISLNLRHMQDSARAPLVLCVLLQSSGKEMFDSVKELVYEVLMSVDHHHATRCLLLAKVLLEFARATSRWFHRIEDTEAAETEDSEVEDSGDGPKAPRHIRMVVEILARTKHLVSSPHLPLRLVILDLIKASLVAVSEYENELLPMIHQNWPGVLARFTDTEKNVACKSAEVIVVICFISGSVIFSMARLSGTFVYHRIVEEFWPKMTAFLLNQAKCSLKTGSVYQQTGAFRLQCLLINELGSLCGDIKALEKDTQKASELCGVYVTEGQPKKLQESSRCTSERLQKLNEASRIMEMSNALSED